MLRRILPPTDDAYPSQESRCTLVGLRGSFFFSSRSFSFSFPFPPPSYSSKEVSIYFCIVLTAIASLPRAARAYTPPFLSLPFLPISVLCSRCARTHCKVPTGLALTLADTTVMLPHHLEKTDQHCAHHAASDKVGAEREWEVARSAVASRPAI